jgi:hypothetical protein
LKCDEKAAKSENAFEPESPFVIVCEGFHERSLTCALLVRLGITNCDVTFPKHSGKSGIKDVVALLAGREEALKGVFIVADADTNAQESFKMLCKAYASPFPEPLSAFTVHQGKKHRTGIFLMPGKGKTGALEHLLLEAVKEKSPQALECIENFENCVATTEMWTENKKAKMRFACYVATHCKNDPSCGTGFIWTTKNLMLEINSPVFEELCEFLQACGA